ncbi:MAG: NAD-binding protein [Intrasporangiaceae bacterium]|nr:NAD-binding protein [Intrasporangiaceae bacterium]
MDTRSETGEVDMADREKRSPYSLVALIGTILAFALGTWGYARAGDGSVVDHAYRSLQLFVLETGDGFPRPAPWQLELARLVAPAMTALSTAVGIAALSRARFDSWRARRKRGHVVIAGLGRRETEAALLLQGAGHDVVAIEVDGTAGGVRRCRRAGIPVVIGDARYPDVLQAAGTARADHLIILTSDLEASGAVALAAIGLCRARSEPPLVVHIEIDDPDFARLLRALILSERHSRGWRIEELDLSRVGAALLVDTAEPWPASATTAEVMVVGDAPLAAAVVCEVRRRWRARGQDPAKLTVSREPRQSPRSCGRPPDAVYVCVDDDAGALTAALAVLTQLPGVPVTVRLEHAAELGSLLAQDEPDLHVVSLDRQVLTAEFLLDTTVERIARALHESYRHHADPADASAVAWQRLPETLRASNRSQAAHVAAKIRATRRVLVPDDGQRPDVFTEDEVQQLGRLEHDRWTTERRAAGWTPGPRDSQARTTPYLVSWEELDEDIREIDRQFVRVLPDVLADAGLLLRRVQGDRAPVALGQGLTRRPS